MPQVDDIGTVITGTVKEDGAVVDLTAGGDTTAQMLFNPPGGSILTKTGVIGTPSNGQVAYTTISGDLSVPGRWTVVVKVTMSSPSRVFSSLPYPFDVGPKFA